jgi:hypothetical protein
MLVATEDGRCLPSMGEEVSRHRRARKVLELSGPVRDAELFVLARPHEPTSPSLLVSVNGWDPDRIPPDRLPWSWRAVAVSGDRLKTGPNVIELWADCASQDGWTIAIELGSSAARSSLVTWDAGASWHDTGVGYASLGVQGEYLVRLRLPGSSIGKPPEMVWESDDARRADLLDLLPASLRRASPGLDLVRRLTSWVASHCDYYNRSAIPAPWDPATILSWSKAKRGTAGYRPTIHCVHRSVTFAMLACALGMPARCSALTGCRPDRSEYDSGHFIAEVWLEDQRKWVFVDPTMDAVGGRGYAPRSLEECRAAGPPMEEQVLLGPAHARQLRNPILRDWSPRVWSPGTWMRFRALWPRMDFLSRPDLVPVAHGQMAYSEVGLVWEEAAHQGGGFGMFRHFAPPEYFAESPRDFPWQAPPGARRRRSAESPADLSPS